MNKEQREIRNAEIVRLRMLNYSMNEIAEKMNITFAIVHYVSEKHGLAGRRSERITPPHEPSNKHTEESAAAFVKVKLPAFEFAGNYTGSDGAANIRCKTCGTVITRSWVTIRHQNVKCPHCELEKREKLKKLKRQELDQVRQERLQKKKEERKHNRLLNRKSVQTTLKVCPVCHSVFIGRGTYCSEHCRQQNHWHMKNGYRYLFPLEEVYERDHGICYICGEPCDWNDYEVKDGVIIYGNNYPSRDHVVPKSKGGKNDWNNIRLAHRLCNSLKASKEIAPIAIK